MNWQKGNHSVTMGASAFLGRAWDDSQQQVSALQLGFDDDNDPSDTYHVGVVAEVGASGVSIISGNVSDRITQHDINWGGFNGDFIGYVAPVAA